MIQVNIFRTVIFIWLAALTVAVIVSMAMNKAEDVNPGYHSYSPSKTYTPESSYSQAPSDSSSSSDCVTYDGNYDNDVCP